ncbi:MAG: DUF1553 domain-containing protein [Verrucomicrobia bacterium]|nr:DUF1553 domain-containing protein [Verrucomicrobiota bacterium]
MISLGKSPSAGVPLAHFLTKISHIITISTAAAIYAQPGIAADTAPAPAAKLSGIYESAAAPKPRGKIDELVFTRLQSLGVPPAHGCTDAVFVRRVYLDVIGTLPTAAEVRQFLQDKSPTKRAALIDQLLNRDEYADYWAMKWSDLLRVKAEFPVNLWPNAAQAYHHWIVTSLRANLPYDQFARELLTSNGSNFRVGPVNFYRAVQNKEPASIARTVALTFLGERAEKWPEARLASMGAFFTQLTYKGTGEWKEEIVFFDPNKPQPAKDAPPAAFPDGTPATLSPDRDAREVFTNWLVDPKNPWFARVMANRVWSWLLGRGIVHEPDDFRADNPPTNPALLALLEREFVAAHYDVKQLMRLILNSQTYQLSSLARSTQPEAEANFAFYVPRRLDAEVLIDALNQITGTTERYSSAIPEPYTFVPDDQRSIALPDGSITSSFLENFGRPSRDTGLESERNNRITASQRLTLLNSTLVQRKIEQGPKLQSLIRARAAPREVIDNLYLTILSRLPTPAERATITAHSLSGPDGRNTVIDLAWALINSAEFLYRH